MPYRCMIIDDEELARELLFTHLAHLDEFELVASCANALEARKVLQTEKVDLLFLDVEMPMIKGTDFFKQLDPKPKVIFTTAFRNYAVEGFELNAVDYLLKPILFDRFVQAIDKFVEVTRLAVQKGQTKQNYIYVQSNKKNIKLVFDEILYVESLKDYIQIYFSATKRLTIKGSISSLAQELDHRFIRVHRSFLVNMDKVTAFTKQDIEIGNIEIPIGESYKSQVLQRLK